MIALDTNVLVRLFMNDDPEQTAASLRVLNGVERVLLLDTVLLETVWVLQSIYAASREDAFEALQRLLAIATPQTRVASQALEWFRDGMDFADALHLATATAARCETLVSFDSKFVQSDHSRSACAVAAPR